MKILRKGRRLPEKFKHKCTECGCKFLVESGDFEELTSPVLGDYLEFMCPNCEKVLRVTKRSVMTFW